LQLRRLSLASSVAAALAASLVLAGCGGSATSSPGGSGPDPTPTASGPTPQAKEAVAGAAATTERSTAKVHISVVLSKQGQATTSHYLADGAIGPRGGRIEIDRTLLGGGIQHEVLVRQGGHLVVYTSPSAITLPAGRSWLKIDLTTYAQRRYGADTTFFAGADQDPFQPLELLGSPAAKVRDLGLDWLPDHTLNTHYRGTVSLLAAARAAGAKQSGLAQIRTDLGAPTQTVDVWVSKKGRVARVIVQGPAKAPDGSTLTLRSTIDFTAYGTKAPVAVPPAKKVEDYFSLFPK
jgi:hypothetical protein